MSVAVRHGRLSQTNLVFGQLEPSPARAPPRPGGRETGDGALADEGALELRQGREDPEYQLAAGCRGVDVGALSGEDTQPDATVGKAPHCCDQMLEVPAKPIELLYV